MIHVVFTMHIHLYRHIIYIYIYNSFVYIYIYIHMCVCDSVSRKPHIDSFGFGALPRLPTAFRRRAPAKPLGSAVVLLTQLRA